MPLRISDLWIEKGLRYMKSLIKDEGMHSVLPDEIQRLGTSESVLNELL